MKAKLNTLVIEPDPRARIKFKQITHSTGQFHVVKFSYTLKEGLETLGEKDTPAFDVIFLPFRLGEEVIAQFIEQGKRALGGEDSAYVVFLRVEDQQKITAVQAVLKGADGFLLEPYPAGAVEEIINLTRRMKEKRSQARKAAIEFLVDDSMLSLDEVAHYKLLGKAPGERLKYFRKLGKVLFKLNDTNLESYYNIALSKYTILDLPPPVIAENSQTIIFQAENPQEMENQLLNEAILNLTRKLEAAGMDVRFLHEAISRIKMRMRSQGITADFNVDDSETSEAVIKQRRKEVVARLKQRIASCGIEANILKNDR